MANLMIFFVEMWAMSEMLTMKRLTTRGQSKTTTGKLSNNTTGWSAVWCTQSTSGLSTDGSKQWGGRRQDVVLPQRQKNLRVARSLTQLDLGHKVQTIQKDTNELFSWFVNFKNVCPVAVLFQTTSCWMFQTTKRTGFPACEPFLEGKWSDVRRLVAL